MGDSLRQKLANRKAKTSNPALPPTPHLSSSTSNQTNEEAAAAAKEELQTLRLENQAMLQKIEALNMLMEGSDAHVGALEAMGEEIDAMDGLMQATIATMTGVITAGDQFVANARAVQPTRVTGAVQPTRVTGSEEDD